LNAMSLLRETDQRDRGTIPTSPLQLDPSSRLLNARCLPTKRGGYAHAPTAETLPGKLRL